MKRSSGNYPRLSTGDRQRHHRRGVTVTEFAIVAPLFFAFLIAGIEFCLLNTIRSTVTNAAYEGARKMVIPGATIDSGTVEVTRILRAIGVRKFEVDVRPAVLTDETEEVTVEIHVPYDDNAFFTPWIAPGIVISAEATMLTERYGGFTESLPGP